MNVHYKIGQKTIDLELIGETIKGEDKVILNEDINIIENTDWDQIGYKVDNFLSQENYNQIKIGIRNHLKAILADLDIPTDSDFSLENYHKYVDNSTHLKVAEKIQPGWNISKFPIDFEIINNRVSEIVNCQVTGEAKHVGIYNFFMRIVRPMCFQDNNPPHRDVWLDRLRNAVNVYIPLSASESDSSLPILPESHYAKESDIERTKEGAMLNGTKYSVPCVISYKNKSPKLIRPEVNENEIMVFSPYLIHGGGYNFKEDKTRVSLEIRFWKK